jgi:hypothetical protein
LVLLILGLQLVVIFWLGEYTFRLPPPVRPAPVLQFAEWHSSELLALKDPTLFAVPHQRTFAGAAWLSVPPLKVQPFAWTEPTNWLALNPARCGAAFEEYVSTNQVYSLPGPVPPEPELVLPQITSDVSWPVESRLRVMGDLVDRPLLEPLRLPVWQNTATIEMLTNTVVRLLVDAQGRPASIALMQPGSGLPEADQYALRVSRAARFRPSPATGEPKPKRAMEGLSWGELVFEWHTVSAVTNGSTAGK